MAELASIYLQALWNRGNGCHRPDLIATCFFIKYIDPGNLHSGAIFWYFHGVGHAGAGVYRIRIGHLPYTNRGNHQASIFVANVLIVK